jgi:hypothetical protein
VLQSLFDLIKFGLKGISFMGFITFGLLVWCHYVFGIVEGRVTVIVVANDLNQVGCFMARLVCYRSGWFAGEVCRK